jgi:hypothetical protein
MKQLLGAAAPAESARRRRECGAQGGCQTGLGVQEQPEGEAQEEATHRVPKTRDELELAVLRLCNHVADLERQALAAAVDAVVRRVYEKVVDAGLIAAGEVHRRTRPQAPPHLRCHVLQVVRARVEAVHEHVQVRRPRGVGRHVPKGVLTALLS